LGAPSFSLDGWDLGVEDEGWVGDSALSYRIAYFGWGDKRGRGLGDLGLGDNYFMGVDAGWVGDGVEWGGLPGRGPGTLGGGIRYGRERIRRAAALETPRRSQGCGAFAP